MESDLATRNNTNDELAVQNNEIDDNSAQNHSTTSNSESLIASTLNAFDARLKQLEEPEEKTLLSKIQKNASFAALIIGILLSLISLFDIFWNKPQESLFRDTEEFNKSVNAVANLRQNMIQVWYQSNNPQMVLEMTTMVMPQVLANIQYATALLPRLGEHVGIPQLIVLIGEAMNIYDWKSATILVDRAVAAKDVPPSMQSEALRYKAKLMFFTGKAQEGRKAFEDAIKVLRDESAYGINGSRAYIVADWAMLEFSGGDCNVGYEQIRKFIDLVKDPKISPQLRTGMISSIKDQLNQLQRCSVPSELQAL